jgi:hypothetical protein
MTELRHKILGTVGAPMEKQETTTEPMSDVDLQSLIELGCVKDTVEIDSFQFVMRSLGATERFELAKQFTDAELPDEEQFKFNVKLLAMAIESINGKPLEELHPNPKEDVLSAKMDIIAALQAPVIAKLLEFYTSVMDRCDKQFGVEQVKN